jgi:ADP-ribose pyrophosphatase
MAEPSNPPPGPAGSAQAAAPGEPDAHLVERLVEPHTVLRGSFLTVRRDVVALPDGQHATREYVVHPGAVVVVPLLDDDHGLVMVRQHRYPVGRVLLEFPAGKLDAGESTLACAMRELAEETGYTAAEWAYGGEIVNAAAYSTESLWIWFARGLVAGRVKLDAGEFVETVRVSESELLALDVAGQLPDVKTIIGLHWLRAWRAGQRALSFTSAQAHRQPRAAHAAGAAPMIPAR